MRRFALLLPFLLAPWLLFAQPQPDRTPYFRVQTWRLTGTWTYAKHFQTVETSGDTTKTRTYDADIHAVAQFRMVQARDHSSRHYSWRLEKGFQPPLNASVRVVDYIVTRAKDGKEKWVKTEINLRGSLQAKAPDGTGRLEIDPSDGACRVVAGFMSGPGRTKITSSEGFVQESESPFAFGSGMDDVRGRASGMTFGGSSPDGSASVPRERPDLDPVAFGWVVSPWEQDPEGEATFDLADHDWRPKLDTTTRVEVKWKGKAEQVRVTLSGISREPGTCLNSDDTSTDEDLVIEKQGPWSVQQDGSQDALKYIALRILPKQDPPQSASLELKARDYGAYGKLQCEVLLDGKWQNAKVSGAESMNVPYDANDNHIADAWEKQEAVTGYPETWDEAEVEGQTAKGDGLTLYAKYRGVRTADKDWTELKAKEKAHFVIDSAGIFDAERWFRSTGIRAYKLDEGMTRYRKVDFNAKTAAGTGKYAVRLERMSGTNDAAGATSGDSPSQWAYSAGGGSPRTTEQCRVFPDRIRGMVDRVTAAMRAAVTDPVVGADALKEWQFLLSLGFTEGEIKARLATLDDAQKTAIVERMVALCAIHEMGHACGVFGHLNGAGDEDESAQRTPSCPSQYLDKKGRRLLLLRGQTTGDGPFCRSAPDNCWTHLNVKD
jgi:hypothetical protein